MSEFDPAPESKTGRARWQEETDTFGRVYDVVLGLTSPTAYTDIAELADCSPDKEKKHLDRPAEMGIARANREVRPATYERHDGYLECQDASRIAADFSVDEIISRVATLENQRSDYEA